MKVSLYINGQQADVNSSGLFLFNYAEGDTDNPAVVKNSYSQSVTLPGTPVNNAILGQYYRLDRTTPTGGFNANRRLPFTLYSEGNEMLESGYLKLDSIKKDNNGVVEYSVTLYGGLGDFLYGLMYDGAGDKLSLDWLTFANLPQTTLLERSTIASGWQALINGTTYGTQYSVINFIPAYNGKPCNEFSYDKAYYRPGAGVGQIAQIVTVDGHYQSKMADGSVLLSMASGHTEWEMQDLRSYQQRPVLSLTALLEALENDASRGDGYHFVVEPSLKATTYIAKGWVTLGLIPWSTYNTSHTIDSRDFFIGTASPGEYLLGLVKTFGLRLHYDSSTKTITLCKRNTFYTGEIVDLTGRIERAKDITPSSISSRRYEWKTSSQVGQEVAGYTERRGVSYGRAIVNTGYQFNEETTDVESGVVFKGASEVLEHSRLFCVYGGNLNDIPPAGVDNYAFKPVYSESVSWRLYWAYTDSEGHNVVKEKEESVATPINTTQITYALSDGDYSDFFPKMQFHGEDNKSEDGMNVLVMFDGTSATPPARTVGYAMEAVFRLTDDSASMLQLNDGRPCWDVSPLNGTVVTAFPVFKRYTATNGGHGLYFGDPAEVFTRSVPPANKGVYDHCWKAFVEERYSDETRVVKAKVNLRGMRVDSSLLRSFYYFDSSLWVLSKINNHSATTAALTECEFIKVNDTTAYTNGQTM